MASENKTYEICLKDGGFAFKVSQNSFCAFATRKSGTYTSNLNFFHVYGDILFMFGFTKTLHCKKYNAYEINIKILNKMAAKNKGDNSLVKKMFIK